MLLNSPIIAYSINDQFRRHAPTAYSTAGSDEGFGMTRPKDNKEFNETLKRMMDSKPKPHEEMKKKGREPQKEKRDGRNASKGS